MDDVVLHTCGPAELDARIRLAIGRASAAAPDDPAAHVIHRGEVVVDDATYTARIGGRPLDLTYKEFELLKYLAQHPGRVFSREQLLQEVWGYDYFGGTRTVDVHVRRLRAKLGTEHEHHIGTVRNVGYRFVLPADARRATPASRRPGRGRARPEQPRPDRPTVDPASYADWAPQATRAADRLEAIAAARPRPPTGPTRSTRRPASPSPTAPRPSSRRTTPSPSCTTATCHSSSARRPAAAASGPRCSRAPSRRTAPG